MQESLCILVRRGPYGTIHAAEAIRHLNGAVANGIRATAILFGDGVYMAKDGQDTEKTEWTSISRALRQALEGKIENRPQVYVHEQSLQERRLDLSDLVPGVLAIDDQGIARLIANSQWVMIY
mgnify:CR=1 FL=1